jgi:hypothetical protein
MEERPLAVLQRWEASGGTWRTRRLAPGYAEVVLCTCHGEPVEELRSDDPALLEHLARRPSSED